MPNSSHPKLVVGKWNKQRNLHMRLILRDCEASRSPNCLPSLKVYREAKWCSVMYSVQLVSQYLPLSRLPPWSGSHCGRIAVRTYILGMERLRGPPVASDVQSMVMSSEWSPPTLCPLWLALTMSLASSALCPWGVSMGFHSVEVARLASVWLHWRQTPQQQYRNMQAMTG